MVKQAAKRTTNIDIADEQTDLDDLIGYNLKRSYVVAQADFQAALGEDGLSTRVFSALSLTVRFPNITQSDLARMMGIERSGLVAIVDELEAKNYLRRAPVPGDRRVQALVPTDAGREAYEIAVELVRAHEARLFANITPSEKETLIGLLQRIWRNEVQT